MDNIFGSKFVASCIPTVGVGILRRAWVNLDLLWAASLLGRSRRHALRL